MPPMSDRHLPNFLIIGAAKSGTTSLWYYLRQHPQIYLSPRKEPRFFAYEGETVAYRGPGDEKWTGESVTTLEAYQALFEPSVEQIAVGEASNVYLYFAEKTAPRIARRIPHARLICILRNPVDRAYSNFLMLRGEGRERHADFRRALQEEDRRLRDGWSPGWAYTRRGFYADSISVFLEHFPRRQMLFFLYEDLRDSPQHVLGAIFDFLGVRRFTPDMSQRYNVSSVPRWRWLAYALRHRTPLSRTLRLFIPEPARKVINAHLRKAVAQRPPEMSPELCRTLQAMFAEDIAKTAALIGRDLSHWTPDRIRD